jgi:hypothetical protein
MILKARGCDVPIASAGFFLKGKNPHSASPYESKGKGFRIIDIELLPLSAPARTIRVL